MSKKEKKDKDKEKEAKRDVVQRRRPLEVYWPYGRFNALHDFDRLFNDFRREFDDMFWDPFYFPRQRRMQPRVVRTGAFRTPSVDLKDTGKEFILKAELPGIPKDNIDISVTNTGIEIKAEAKEEKAEEGECYVCQERSYQTYHRKIEFPEDVLPDKVKAEMKDGILQVMIPKKAPAEEKVHKIKIK